MSLDVYRCMVCGEYWTHGGSEVAYQRALRHRCQLADGRPAVLVGDYDALGEMWNDGVGRIPPQVPDPARPHLPPGGAVETFPEPD